MPVAPLTPAERMDAVLQALQAGGACDLSGLRRRDSDRCSEVFYVRVRETVTLDFAYHQAAGLELRIIQVDQDVRGQGHGRAALRFLLEIADAQAISVYLFAEPYGPSPLGRLALTQWYRRAGFQPAREGMRRPAVSLEAEVVNDVAADVLPPRWVEE